mgnify:CR=1 FL=1|jgi:site-specific DNA-cytosine methylase|nr:MAG TPA: DNA cytosine methyltransferase [Caudoviricetes sp.]
MNQANQSRIEELTVKLMELEEQLADKQAGNGVTVNVVEAIGKKIKEYENN